MGVDVLGVLGVIGVDVLGVIGMIGVAPLRRHRRERLRITRHRRGWHARFVE